MSCAKDLHFELVGNKPLREAMMSEPTAEETRDVRETRAEVESAAERYAIAMGDMVADRQQGRGSVAVDPMQKYRHAVFIALDAHEAAITESIRARTARLEEALRETAQWFHHVQHVQQGVTRKESFMDCGVLPCRTNMLALTSTSAAQKQPLE